MEKAKEEHKKTLEGSIDEEVRYGGLTPNEDVTEDIASNAVAEIEAFLERERKVIIQARGILVTEQEVRELAGILNPKGPSAVKIESLEAIAEQYHLEALGETDPMKKTFYESVEKL